MKLHRLVPQPLAELVCGLRRHRQRRYEAHKDGKLLVVYTCRCGKSQSAAMHAANRKVRRSIIRAARRKLV